jgi:hypothetical protein
MIERELSTEEANEINDRVDRENIEPFRGPEYDKHGFDLYFRVDGKVYRLVYDRETYFTEIGYEVTDLTIH